jgi:hypothetical protein
MFNLSSETLSLAVLFLEKFNSEKITLTDLSPHKRILLFFFTRAVKTYSAIRVLCGRGYGQDAAVLLRNLLENLICVKYILYDPLSSDMKAVRFVEYKWVILHRHMGGRSKKTLITEKYKEYKQKYGIFSDRGLLTWSGKSVETMARLADSGLLKEYEFIFRPCSRFSHPSIIGDNEYIRRENGTMTFLPFSSSAGIVQNLKKSVSYLFDFMVLFSGLFVINGENDLAVLKSEMTRVFQMDKYAGPPPEKTIFSVDEHAGADILISFDTSFFRPLPVEKSQ